MRKLILILLIPFLSLSLLLLAQTKVLAVDSANFSPEAPISSDKILGGKDGFVDIIAKSLDCRLEGCPDAEITGAIPFTTNYLAMMITDKPASTSRYVAHLMKNIGLPTPPSAYAQGVGYRMFEPVIKLWQVFRNLAYTIYILIFLVIGFMIMFRTKINAQTVISIQSALPNLLITLLLITFSYAIAGFLIDIMYFTIYFLVYLAGSNRLLDAKMTMDYFLKHNLISIFFPSGDNLVLQRISIAIQNLFFSVIGSVQHAQDKNLGSDIIQFFISVMVFLQLVKLFISLLKNYLMVIIQIITAPLQLLPNAIPGSKAFMTWLKTLASYLAPFPIITALFLLAIIFAIPSYQNNPFGVTKPIFGSDSKLHTFPYIAGMTTTSEDIAGLMAFAIILISPAAVKMSQDFFKVKESPYTSEVMTGLKSSALPFQMASGWWNRHRANLNQRNLISAIQNQGKDDASGGRRT